MIPNPEPAANDNFGQAVAEVNGNILIGRLETITT